MDHQTCSGRIIICCCGFMITAVIFGPTILGFFGVPGLQRVIAEDKYASRSFCMFNTTDCHNPCNATGCPKPCEIDLAFLRTENKNESACLLVYFYLQIKPNIYVSASLVTTFEEAYDFDASEEQPYMNVSRSYFTKQLLPSLNAYADVPVSEDCFLGRFECFFLSNKPYVIYTERGSHTLPLVLFSVGIALTVLGGGPIIILCVMFGGDQLSLKHMVYKSKKREQKVKDTLEILASNNEHRKLKAMKNLDLTTEYFVGRYHRGTLFDIAAHIGNIEALEYMYTLPQITIDGAIPTPEIKTKTRKNPKRTYEAFPRDLLSERRRTPLHHACIGYQFESVQFFVGKGANVNIQDPDGDTPLLAVLKEAVRVKKSFNSMHQILELLIEAGTDLSLCGRFTPIYSACTIGCQKLIYFIAQSGSLSTKMVTSFHQDTPLTILIKQNSLAGIKILTQAGYNLNDDPLFSTRLESNRDIASYLHECLETVTPLKLLCRNVIRHTFGTIRVKSKVMTLPLPSILLSYINLENCMELIDQEEAQEDINASSVLVPITPIQEEDV